MKTPGGGGYGTPSSNGAGIGSFAGINLIDDEGMVNRFVERGSVYEYRMNQESV